MAVVRSDMGGSLQSGIWFMYSRRVPPLPIYMHLHIHRLHKPTDTYNTTIACVHVHASTACVREGGSYARIYIRVYIRWCSQIRMRGRRCRGLLLMNAGNPSSLSHEGDAGFIHIS